MACFGLSDMTGRAAAATHAFEIYNRRLCVHRWLSRQFLLSVLGVRNDFDVVHLEGLGA